ncbi:hypothetical protein Kisp02_22000 [Kineosporia sp. NBRC 101731]|nr:hypothetical protein Kisp02_22000 [Kineosporia sp. NBRC 101731]
MGLLMVAQAMFWGLASFLPFPVLPAVAFLGGLTTLPAFIVIRPALANRVTEEHRHTAYAADAITTDIAYMSGPALGILLASATSPRAAFLSMGALLLTAGTAYLLIDPPLRAARPAGGRRETIDRPMAHTLHDVRTRDDRRGGDLGDEFRGRGHRDPAAAGRAALELAAAGGGRKCLGDRQIRLRRLAQPAVGVHRHGRAGPAVPIGLAGTWYWLCLFALPANLLVAPALSASADAISRITPDNSKGVAMGSYANAVLAGSVIGSPRGRGTARSRRPGRVVRRVRGDHPRPQWSPPARRSPVGHLKM